MCASAENVQGGAHNQYRATDGAHRMAQYDRENEGANINGITSNNQEPRDGMEFESKEDAFSFYKEYANSVGFSAIIKASRRSRISGKFIDAKFVCTKYGSKRESGKSETPEAVPEADNAPVNLVKRKRGRINHSWTKTDCKACMHVKRRQDGRWIIRTLFKEHNHEINHFQGHRNVDIVSNQVDALKGTRGRTKKMYTTMCRLSSEMKVQNQKSGGTNASNKHLGFEDEDVQALLDHFMLMQDENPNFFYAIDLDQEQRLKNVFWVDAKARLDYGHFNDVVLLDTSFIKSEYKLSFAPFIGLNHHFQFFFLGCALIADENKSTLVWLINAWLRAMGGQAPKVILSDQDKTLQGAIAEVLPGSRHCFCLWHILSKIPEKLAYVITQHDNFITKFNKCILKSATNELFEKRWLKMVDRFDLRNDLWIQSLYEDRKQWVPTYMKDICLAGMSTTQRSENISSLLDRFIQRRTTFKEFLNQYKRMLQGKYEDEAKADFETWHKQPSLKSPSPYGKQMAVVYTHTIFKKFQGEVLGVVACHPRKESENGTKSTFKVQDFEENQDFIVTWDEDTADTSCSCHFFEYNGFLCRHVMIVFQMSGVHSIPSKYILKRWTKDAKRTETTTRDELVQSRVQRYSDLCQRAFRLGDEGSLSQESYHFAFSALEEAFRKCEIQKANRKNDESRKGKEQSRDILNMGIRDDLQPTEHSSFQAPTLDCPNGSQESIEGMGQLSSRVPNLDVYFATQQIGQGVGQLNSFGLRRTEFYYSQQSMQSLGQLESLLPIHDARYLTQERLRGLEQSNAGTTDMLAMTSKHLQLKRFPR